MSPRRAAASLALAASLAWTRAAAQSPSSGADSVHQAADASIVELALGRYVSRTVPAFRDGEAALLPLAQLADLAEIAFRPLPRGGVELIFQPGNRRVVVDPAGDQIRAGRETVVVGPGDRVVQAGEQYLSTRVLSGLLHARFAVNWSDLTVALVDADSLPVARRLTREKLRTEYRAGLDSRTPDLALGLERTRWDGVVLDYSVMAPSQDVLGGAYSTAMGMNLMGGSLEAAVASTGRPRDGNVRVDGSWTGVWRDNRWLSQVRLGDGLSSGPRPRTVRGFAVSNVPFLRPSLFGDIPFQGGLGPGWQIEAYRGGRLLALDSADALGRFSLDVPVEYGENPVDFVAYGPFGEVRQFNQTYRVAANVLPQGRFEYGVSLGGCRSSACRANGNLDLRYGLSRRWTVRAGLDRFWRDTLPTLSHPYAALSGALGNAWAIEAEAVASAVLRGALRYEPTEYFRLSTELNRFATGLIRPILTPDGRRSQWTTSLMARPFPRRNDVFFDATVDRIAAATGDVTSGRLGLSVYTASLRLSPAVRFSRFSDPAGVGTSESFVSLNLFAMPLPQLGPVFGRVSGRAVWEVSAAGGMTTAAGYLSRPLGNAINLEAGAGWARGTGTSLSLYLSTALPSLTAITSVTAPLHGPATATQFVQGSVLYNPRAQQLGFASGPAIERAGVSGRVFLDENGDGKLDAGEPLLPDVRIRAGFGSSVSDSSGRYRVWDLPAFEAVVLTVDSASLASPLWVPAYGSVSVETGPNRFRAVDIPVVPGGVIEGTLSRLAPGGPVPVAGMRLLLRRKGSREVRSLVTFSDGAFYLMGVKPGDYILSAEGETLSRLGLVGEPLDFTMPASRDGATVDGLALELR